MTNQEIIQLVDELRVLPKENEWVELLFDKLPEFMTDKQKNKKIENILQEIAGTRIINTGSRIKPKWVILINLGNI